MDPTNFDLGLISTSWELNRGPKALSNHLGSAPTHGTFNNSSLEEAMPQENKEGVLKLQSYNSNPN